MIRSQCIRAIQSFIQAAYTGSVRILTEEGTAAVTPPCAVIRVGSAVDIGLGQVDIWDLNMIVAVWHDADTTPIENAEASAAAVFDVLRDAESVINHLGSVGVVASAWLPLTSEAGREETRWQHFHGFRLIAAPA